ncbi:aspartic peptidase domain-containing protein [Trametes maxima]|nr:aspartic peptidase domain-containing protein [Trametes maxima]
MAFSSSIFLALAFTFFSSSLLANTQNVGTSTSPGVKYGSLSPSSPVDVGLNVFGADEGYTIDITLGGQNFTVILDTGSTDLWVDASGLEMHTTNVTDLNVDFSYAIGEVQGNIAFADLQIGPYFIPNQVYVNASKASDMPPGVNGIIGMAFDTTSIYVKLLESWGRDTAGILGRAPMTNLLAQDPSTPGFFDLRLGRQSINGTEEDGHLFIGQHLTGATAVTKAPKIPRVDYNHWTLLMDGMKINGRPYTGFSKSVQKSVPEGKVATVLDTGFTYSQLPVPVVDAIYSSIPGAILYNGTVPGIDNQATNTTWIVPCNASANISFAFGGQDYPVHPRDVIRHWTGFELQKSEGVSVLANTTICTNRYFAAPPISPDYDMLLGMVFLRNVYASFQYGDYTPPGVNSTGQLPYVQILSVIDPDTAWAEFEAFAAHTLATAPPALDPPTLVKFLTAYNANQTQSDPSSSSSSTSDASIGSSSSDASPSTSATALPTGQVDAAAGNLSVSGAASDNTSDSGSGTDYKAIAIGLLGANLAVALAVLGVTVVMCVRGGKAKREARYQPLRLPKSAPGVLDDAESGTRYSD